MKSSTYSDVGAFFYHYTPLTHRPPFLGVRFSPKNACFSGGVAAQFFFLAQRFSGCPKRTLKLKCAYGTTN
jgi:hypothetical protein